MTAADLAQALSQITFVVLGALVLERMRRVPSVANANAAAFFGTIVVLVVLELGLRLAGVIEEPPSWAARIQTALILLLPLILLRLADDFMELPPIVLRIATVAAAASVAVALVMPEWIDGPIVLFLIAYFVATAGYAALRFLVAARNTRGLTQRRLQSVSAGAGLLMALVLVAVPAGIFPDAAEFWRGLTSVMALGSGLAFYGGFAPPQMLKDAWQAPEVRQLLAHGTLGRSFASHATAVFLADIQEDILRALGAREVTVWLWDEDAERLVTISRGGREPDPTELVLATEVYETQEARITRTRPRGGLLLIAPITRADEHCGVVTARGADASVFAQDDLLLLEALAAQVAFALAYRALAERLSDARAREETNRLKDDFLSSIAHDLQTPLTTLLGEAQLMDRIAAREPGTPIDRQQVGRMIAEAGRMRLLARELLDANRAERASLLGELSPVDLGEIALEVAGEQIAEGHRFRTKIHGQTVVMGDRSRLKQVMGNLLENAFKYSPDGGEVHLEVLTRESSALITVRDEGIGIAAEDLPHIFERYWRSSRIDDRRFAGTGLGLFLTQRIAQEHGGDVMVASTLGKGSTFTVVLPLSVQIHTSADLTSAGGC